MQLITPRSILVAAIMSTLAIGGCGTDGASSSPPTTSQTEDTGTTTVPNTANPSGPLDPEAAIAPDLIVVSPTAVTPGSVLEVTFPDETRRGVGYVLEAESGPSWNAIYALTAGDQLETLRIDRGETYGWDEVAVSGVGPDEVYVPNDAPPGAYRLCTANAASNICAIITVTA